MVTALGNYLAGAIAVFWHTWDHSTFFFVLVGTSLFAAAVLWSVMRRREHAMSLVAPGRPAAVCVDGQLAAAAPVPARR